MGMVREVRNEVRRCKFCSELLLPRLRPLPVDELEEIESDPDAVDSYQARDVLDVIDVAIERALFLSRAHENGVSADHSAAFADHLDLFIADVAFDVIVAADVRVRHNGRSCCDRENLLKPCRIDVREINNHTELLAFVHDLATKGCQALGRRTARCENSAMPSRVGSNVCKAD